MKSQYPDSENASTFVLRMHQSTENVSASGHEIRCSHENIAIAVVIPKHDYQIIIIQ